MTRYFCGNSMAHFDRSSPAVVESFTAGTFDPAYVPNSLVVPGTSNNDYIQSAAFSATGTVWMRFSFYQSGGNANGLGPALYSGLNGVFRFVQVGGGGPLMPQYWNGTTWINTGPTFAFSGSTLLVFSVKVMLNSGFELYMGNTLVSSGSGWSGGPTTATHFRGYMASQASVYYSEVMIADYDVGSSRYGFSGINGNSLVNTGGTGTYTDVNEGVVNDATSIDVSVVGNKMGQTHAALTVPPGYRIAAMVLGARGMVSGGTVTNGKLGVRTAGGSNNSGAGLGYGTSYSARERIIDNDPDTGVPFNQAGYNGAEVFEEAA